MSQDSSLFHMGKVLPSQSDRFPHVVDNHYPTIGLNSQRKLHRIYGMKILLPSLAVNKDFSIYGTLRLQTLVRRLPTPFVLVTTAFCGYKNLH